MNKEDSDERGRDTPSPHPKGGYEEKEEDMSYLGILIFGLIGATVTTFAVYIYSDPRDGLLPLSLSLAYSSVPFASLGNGCWTMDVEMKKVPSLLGYALCVTQLRSTADLIYSQLSRSKSSWNNGRSFRTSFQEEARKRYYRRMREEYEAEMERVERIRQMQSVFNRERSKFKRNYDSWQQHGPGANDQHFQRNDWYWTEDTSFRDHSKNFRETPWANSSSPLSHHYSVLGLDRLRTKPYTDDEIKSAFRAKAKEFHPDQNQDNKEFSEAKFKEVMVSYEAIKSERKNNRRQ